MRFRPFLILLAIVACSTSAVAQNRPRPQYQCGASPALDSITTAGSRWLACDHNYWSSVYRAAKMLSRYDGIDGSCLEQFSEGYKEAAALFLEGRWGEANTVKSRLTCAAGHQVRIDSESISLLCTDQRWTVENAGDVNCPDPFAQHEEPNVTGWAEESGDGITLMVRNNSPARVVRITEWTVYDCVNIRGNICGRHTKPVLLRPGQSTDLGVIRKEFENGGYQYRWTWQSEFVE